MSKHKYLLTSYVILALIVYGKCQNIGENFCGSKMPCDNFECIDRASWCDKEYDCSDGSDERYCNYEKSTWSSCTAWHFICEDGTCVPAVVTCDKVFDCRDFSDEKYCGNETSLEESSSSEENTSSDESIEYSNLLSPKKNARISKRVFIETSPIIHKGHDISKNAIQATKKPYITETTNFLTTTTTEDPKGTEQEILSPELFRTINYPSHDRNAKDQFETPNLDTDNHIDQDFDSNIYDQANLQNLKEQHPSRVQFGVSSEQPFLQGGYSSTSGSTPPNLFSGNYFPPTIRTESERPKTRHYTFDANQHSQRNFPNQYLQSGQYHGEDSDMSSRWNFPEYMPSEASAVTSSPNTFKTDYDVPETISRSYYWRDQNEYSRHNFLNQLGTQTPYRSSDIAPNRHITTSGISRHTLITNPRHESQPLTIPSWYTSKSFEIRTYPYRIESEYDYHRADSNSQVHHRTLQHPVFNLQNGRNTHTTPIKTLPFFQFSKNYTEQFGYVYRQNVDRATQWLINRRDHSYTWGEDTSRALTALSLTTNSFISDIADNNIMKKSLETHLCAKLQGRNINSVTRLALYINALLATCQNPRDFCGKDLVNLLHEERNAFSHSQPTVNPIVYLTLCISESPLDWQDIQKLETLLVTRYADDIAKDQHVLATTALACILKKYDKQDPLKLHHLKAKTSEAAQNLLTWRKDDGSFGSIYSTALAVQALVSVESASWDPKPTLDYLSRQQSADGSFGDMLATYYSVPALSGRSLLHLRNTQCGQINIRDIEP